jgi:cytochrome c oxidase cbb3-type subunit I/II
MLALLISAGLAALWLKEDAQDAWVRWYDRLLANSLPFTLLTAAAVFVGGLIQIIPTILINKADSVEGVKQRLYTPLELTGRDIYIREGCYNCHSQQIRTLVGDVLRYGDHSKIGESIYDHPYQWGSKRTGPDLARIGGKYPDIWHFSHMKDPRQIAPGSTMPNYPWLFTDKTNFSTLPAKIAVQRTLGVPYPTMTDSELMRSVKTDSERIAASLSTAGAETPPDREIIALIAYLQSLGHKPAPTLTQN